MLCRIYLDIRIYNKKGGYGTRFALTFLKKNYRKKQKFLGVTMCNASVNYQKYFCSPMKNWEKNS